MDTILGILNKVECCICGIYFGIPKAMHENLKEHGGSFFCPNGHSLHFGDSRVEQLRRQINALNARLSQAHEEISRQRGVIKTINQTQEKKRRRVNAGVCPHCHRSFVALARHIRSKHPTEPLPNNEAKRITYRSLPTKGSSDQSRERPAGLA
jgi:hypothetical protein